MAWHSTARLGWLLLLYAFWIPGIMAKSTDTFQYETVYACEGKILKIECKDGELIKLVRANYGRFSITICNDHGVIDWSVNCMSAKSLRVLHDRCSHKQNCSIPASTSIFGDPCGGTLKYLEAHYRCMPAQSLAATTTTTNRPSLSWEITPQPPSVWTTLKPTARPPPPPPKASIAPPSQPSTTVSTSTQATTPPPPKDVDDENNHPMEEEEITTLPFTTFMPKRSTANSTVAYKYIPSSSITPPWTKENENVEYCNPSTARNLYWSRTRVGEVNILSCPPGTTGWARWRCTFGSVEAIWSPHTPDLSECRSVWLTSLESRLNSDNPLISIISDLSQVTSSKTLYGGDMMITTKIIKKISQKMSEDIQTFPDQQQREAIVAELLQNVVKTASNLLDSSQHPSWRDLNHKEQMRVATSLLIGLEENAFLLADTVIREKTVVQTDKNIMLSVRVLDTRNIGMQVYPSDDKWSKISNDTIEIPREALVENSEGGFVRLVFVAFNHLEDILEWQPETIESSTNQQANVTKVLNSKVISASLGKGRHIQLSEPVRLTLKHIRMENVSNPSCVFWDYTTSTWSEEGCRVDKTNTSHTICFCDHLTNFAILMDVHATKLPAVHEMALQIITYVGCIVSIICLVLAIITFQLFRGLKSDRTTIHSNLCVCLLIAELLFLVGINQTDTIILCGVVAALLHYFFLCAFVWMFFEGFQLYVMLIEVFEAEKSRIRWYYCIAYGLPLLIVIISGSIDHYVSYGTERYCWLRANNYFIYSFVGPVVIVIVVNLIFLSMAIVMMCRHANATVSMKNKEHSRLASARTWLRGAIVLVFLLGLTWTFGLLYLNQETVTMAYIFAILNSLQGFFIFVFHCVQNEKVRKEYRKFIRRHSWLPKCLRCSKPNGGGASSSSGGSSGGKERRTSLYAGSNGNPSAPNSHSTDNSVLSSHGTSQYVLQRGWSSRSCTTMNRIGKFPVSTSATMAATLSRPPRSGTTTPPPVSTDTHNTSTLPYARNIYKYNSNAVAGGGTVNATANNPHCFPKSVSTWGPLHKPLHWKNISFKSYSRDSGHGGSEQEESPRSHVVTGAPDTQLNNHPKDTRRQPYISGDYQQQQQAQAQDQDFQDYMHRSEIPHPKHLQLPQSLQPHATGRKKNGNFLRSTSPWNHTYTEIHEAQNRLHQRGIVEDDPVYEEIERNEIQISDMSDEDGRRQSDMSRQSSRSYGDHRPLIPYSPATERNIHSCLEAVNKHRNKERYASDIVDPYRMSRQNMYRGDTARSLAAVLDGETVVCHLEPPELYLHDPYNTRTMVLPQYSES